MFGRYFRQFAPLIEDAAAAEVRRNLLLMGDGGIEIGLRLILPLDCADKSVKALESAEFVGAAEFGGLER